MAGILTTMQKKRSDQELIRNRQFSKKNAKEQDEIGTSEVYVTEAYKKKQEELKKFEIKETQMEQYDNEHTINKEVPLSFIQMFVERPQVFLQKSIRDQLICWW